MIPFLDLTAQYRECEQRLLEAAARVFESGGYVLGGEVEAFEREFAGWLGSGHGVGVASGTDAITLALNALGVGHGDDVVTTAFTAVPTVMAIVLAGARPVFADITESGYGLDPAEAERAATPSTRAIVPVHLYGECLDLSGLERVAHRLDVVLVEDACQAHGARMGGRAAGTFGAAGAFSFYPTKNLGAFGDAGLVATDDTAVAGRLRKLRDYGRSCRDLFDEPGRNSRLDELQAAMLRVKLERLDAWNERRRSLASHYNRELEGLPLDLPGESEPGSHVFHLYVVATDGRDALSRHLEDRGIRALVHYPVCPHLQEAFANLGYGPGDFPRAEAASARVLSLPLHPWLSDEDAMTVAGEVRAFFGFPPP